MIHVTRLYQTILHEYSWEWLQRYLFGYTVVLTSSKINFQIWMWINSVLYSGYRMNDERTYKCTCKSSVLQSVLGLIFSPLSKKVMSWRPCILVKLVTTLLQKIARLLKDELELYQGIDLTHNNILINIINDVLAGRFSTMDQ